MVRSAESTNTFTEVLQCVLKQIVDVLGSQGAGWLHHHQILINQLIKQVQRKHEKKPPYPGNYWEKAPPTDMEDRAYNHETIHLGMISSHHLRAQGTHQKRRGTALNAGV